MIKLQRALTVILIVFWMAACQSAAQKESSSELNTSPDLRPTACTENYETCPTTGGTPMVCTMARYDDGLLPEHRLLKGWGNSVCAARSDLKQRACATGLDSRKFGEVSCGPDPSEGECGRLSSDCAPAQGKLFCFAASYDGVKLQPNQMVAGRGVSECAAKVELVKQACILNLKPSLLGDQACVKDAVAVGCPVPDQACGGDYFPSVCESKLQGGILKTSFEAKVFAENSCLTQAKLKHMACNLNIAPESVSQPRCDIEH
jgi:hypothetical protein